VLGITQWNLLVLWTLVSFHPILLHRMATAFKMCSPVNLIIHDVGLSSPSRLSCRSDARHATKVCAISSPPCTADKMPPRQLLRSTPLFSIAIRSFSSIPSRLSDFSQSTGTLDGSNCSELI